MSPPVETRPERRLRGRRIFLSASVPSPQAAERYRRVEDAHLEIEEAVISLARAVFAEGGILVFGGHPAISPLVAMVAGEYITPRLVEGKGEQVRTPIEIYQSRAFEGHLPDETLMMFRLGYARLHWTEAVGGERFDPTAPRGRPRCPRSLRHMRERMIGEAAPLAMVCIGGMEGVEQEVEIFRELRRAAPVYVLGETGGAAALLARRSSEEGLRVIDRKVLEHLRSLRRADAGEGGTESAPEQPEQPEQPEKPEKPEKPLIPYPLIVQVLVDELIHLDERRLE